MKLPTSTLFKDGKKFYAVYSGINNGMAILAGATELHKVPTDQVTDFKEGDRVYFDDKGEMAEVKPAKPPKTATASRSAGNVLPRNSKPNALVG